MVGCSILDDVEDFSLYPQTNEKPLNDFNQGNMTSGYYKKITLATVREMV